MTVRRFLIVGCVLLGSALGFAPSAQAKPAACAWVDPYGVCFSNPLTDLPSTPRLPNVPKP